MRHTRTTVTGAIMLTAAASGCGLLDPQGGDVVVDAEVTIVDFDAETLDLFSEVVAVITNRGEQIVETDGCAWLVERRLENRWSAVYSPPCSHRLPASLEIDPGSTLRLSLPIRTQLGAESTSWRPPLQGVYRVRVRITPQPSSEPHELTSRAFSFVDGVESYRAP